MAAVANSVTIRCPACSDEIELPMQSRIDRTTSPQQCVVQVDTRPIRAHVQTHEDGTPA